jgi:crossover junction endodeoxyribonuclease RuvC
VGDSVRAIGIDPGTENLGYGVVDKIGSSYKLVEAGVVKFKSRELQTSIKELPEHLSEIYSRTSPEIIAVESLFFAKNPQSVLKLAQFRGAILLHSLQTFEKVEEFSPAEVKRAVTGSGRAGKDQVNFMVKRLLGVKSEIKPYDISDALAVAITLLQRS